MSASRFLFILISAPFLATACFAQTFWLRQAGLHPLAPPASLAVVSERIAWVCDFNAQAWRTTDAGKSWRLIGPITHNEKISCLAALDSNVALAGGAGSTNTNGSANLYRTRNGGRSWEVVYTAKGPTPYWYALHMFDATTGIAMSDAPNANENFLIAITNDAGMTWRRVALAPRPQEKEFGLSQTSFFFDRMHGWFGTAVGSVHQNFSGRMFRTSDGGETWTLLPKDPRVDLQALRFCSPMLGVRASALPPFLTRTTDAGQTWQAINNLPVAEIQYLKLLAGIQTTTRQHLWLSGEAGQEHRSFILTSTDSGLNWEEQTLADIGANKILQLAALTFGANHDSVQAWGLIYDFAAKRGGVISYRALLPPTTRVEKERDDSPRPYRLAQNYPNPFSARGIFDNPSTTIQYQLPQAAQVQLAIYNLLGEKVRTLVDAKESAGVKHITWDGRNDLGERVSTGVYLYRIAAGEFKLTKRLVLMK